MVYLVVQHIHNLGYVFRVFDESVIQHNINHLENFVEKFRHFTSSIFIWVCQSILTHLKLIINKF